MPYPNYEINITGVKHITFNYFDDVIITTEHHAWRYNPNKGEVKQEYEYPEQITSIAAGGGEIIFGLSNGEISYNEGWTETIDNRIRCSETPITALAKTLNTIIAGDSEGNIIILSGEKHSDTKRIKVADSPITSIETTKGTIITAPEREPRLIIIDTSHNVTKIDLDYPLTDICMGYRSEWFYTGDTSGLLMKWSIPEYTPVDAVYTDETPITSIEVIYDRPQVWTGHKDGKVKIFNLETHKPLGITHLYDEPVKLAYTEYGAYILSASGEKPVDIWVLDKQVEEPEEEPVEEPIPDYLLEAYNLIDRYDTTGTLTATIKDSEPSEQPALAGTTLIDMANKLNEEDKSIGQILDAAKRIFKEINANKSLGDIAMLQGSTHHYIDDQKANRHYAEAIEYYQATESHRELSEAYIKHGQTLRDIGVDSEAHTEFINAALVAEENGYPLIEAEALREMAGIMKGIDNDEEADSLLAKAYPLAADDPDLAGKILIDRAQIAFKQRRNKDSINHYSQAYNTFTELNQPYYLAVCCLGAGYAYLSQQDNNEAETHISEAITLIQLCDNKILLKTAYEGLALALNGQGRRTEAIQAMTKAEELEKHS